MIPGYDSIVRHNFNHFMYADDLILIPQASRKSACNINLCFSIYEQLIGQHANSFKSEIFFPTRFNRRLKKTTSDILNFKSGMFPLTYLGFLISPNHLALSNFNTMLAKIEKTISFLNHSSISMTGKTILINFSIMLLPCTTFLFVLFPI